MLLLLLGVAGESVLEFAQAFHPALTLEFFMAFIDGPTAGFAGPVVLPSESNDTKDEA